MLQRTRAADNGQRILTFSLPLEWAGRASVVGNFNDWTPGALPLVAVDGAAEASVVLPDDYIAVFRYLGEGDQWFDEPDADHIDGGGSVVLGVEAGDLAPAEPAASAERLPSPAERSVKLIDKRRKKAKKAAEKAAAKARQKASDLAAKVARAADKQRKAAARVAKEQERQAKKRARAERAASK